MACSQQSWLGGDFDARQMERVLLA